MLACATSHGEPTAKQPLTVADAIQTTRFMQSARVADPDPRADGVFVSPDGRRYAVMLIRGDLKRAEGAGNWVEILAGRLENLDRARPQPVARLFTQSWGTPDPVLGVPSLTWPRFNPLVWLPDNERVAFLWPDEKDVVQVATVHLGTGQLTYLTQEPANVVSFELTPTGSVLYPALIAHSRERSQQLVREGFTVGDGDLIDVISGDVDGYGAFDRSNNTHWSIAGPGGPPRRYSPNGASDRSVPQFRTVFSADGRRALMGHYPEAVPPEWSRYTERYIALRMAAHQVSPNAIQARYIKQLFVLDLEKEQMRPLWAAPMARGALASWSPDGQSVLVGPALLPLDGADEAGLAGRAFAEVDVASGRYRQVKLPAANAGQPVQRMSWLGADRIEIVQQASTLRFRKDSAGWQLEETVPTPPARAREIKGVRVEWRQDSATPPVLYAIDGRSKRERAVFDPNPDLLKRFQLGRVEFITWKDKQNREWRGRLYHPARETPGARVPLVIQTHGFAPPTEFSLYGNGGSSAEPGLGPGYSVYAAQPLASKGIAVLQVEDLPPALAHLTVSPEEPVAYMGAYESAVEHLAGRGLIDPARVGIVGFSRTGWHVAYALTHSPFRFAAAIISDSFGGDYMGAALSGWNAEISRNIGAEPFGEGLNAWLQRTPAFNVEKLTTPLRIQLESGGLAAAIGKWELFSRARYLKKNIELYVIPDIERGSHGIQNPLQCLAAQQGAVTWFESWLLQGRAPGPTQPPTPARP